MDIELVRRLYHDQEIMSGSYYMAIGILGRLETGTSLTEIAIALDTFDHAGGDPASLKYSDQALAFIRKNAETLGLRIGDID